MKNTIEDVYGKPIKLLVSKTKKIYINILFQVLLNKLVTQLFSHPKLGEDGFLWARRVEEKVLKSARSMKKFYIKNKDRCQYPLDQDIQGLELPKR